MNPYDADGTVAHTGAGSMKVNSTDAQGKWGAVQLAHLGHTDKQPVLLCAFSKSSDVDGTSDSGYSITVDFIFHDHTYHYNEGLLFSTGTHEWEQLCTVYVPSKPLLSVVVYMSVVHHQGIIWFDDVVLVDDAETIQAGM